ncbi:DEAD/DEAH box helicase [Actinomadura sp. GC306]|uniref:DEAD/DEAH box helicase n=1 Tax=Actinomadura sp. GC306 TaxID=2530367 RepID=UPI00104C1076|nr:DEAD/DEAH box helicase [Actinomadura sp. GC306]TDC60704.1 DEAD/DEAH box helicase [Actinomadura sp. GC306]
MTTSPRSGSEGGGSRSYDLLHPAIQRWIWQKQWKELHDAQEVAIPAILAGEEDILISAATASGKTEAAFLPICSALADSPSEGGFGAVYIGPLKALINDQFGRLEELCGLLEIPVHKWHGDVDAARKARLVRQASGIVLITPESLEALLANRGTRVPSMFQGVRHIVIDELHSFIGTARGAQLRSLLHRLELAVRRRIPRIGLSATLGDMRTAAEFLRPAGGERVRLIESNSDGQELRFHFKGFLNDVPRRRGRPDDEQPETIVGRGDLAVADHLFSVLRGSGNLVFANSRQKVELFTDLLVRRADQAGVPNEFVPHHGSLAKEIREDTEARLRESPLPVTAVCTSTLEMGIDIGSITSVAQIGPPPGVAALRQRLGRTGRRGGPATLRMYVTETEVTPASPPHEELRTQLVQMIAVVNLLLTRWCEPPETGGLHLSTLVQQVLSLIAQHGGVLPQDAYRALCSHGPFRHVDPHLFKMLLRDLGEADLLRQEKDGLLLHGGEGEHIVNHHTFYAAFHTPDEYRLVSGGRTLGSLPLAYPLVPGDLMIFAGRRWRIVTLDPDSKVIELTPAGGGKAPEFSGGAAYVHDRIRTEMRVVYESDEMPIYLDSGAQKLLTEGRNAYRRLNLAQTSIVGWGNDTLLIPLRGDTIMNTLALALHRHGISVNHQGVALVLDGTAADRATSVLTALAAEPPPDPESLAALVPDQVIEKYDDVLGEELRAIAYAARKLDVPATWAALPDIAAAAETCTPAHHTKHAPPSPQRHRIGALPYAVIDVETNGLNALNDRIIEIAVHRLNGDGTPDRSFSTVLSNDRGPGPTRIHGLTAGDLAGAPTFREVAGDIAELIDGAVLVAHNAMFDSAMLLSEFARAGAAPDDLLTLCTLDLARRFGSGGSSLTLTDCADTEGVPLPQAHSAHHDAQATAALLRIYLDRAHETSQKKKKTKSQAGQTWSTTLST